jgi:poly(3-hydroxybutyrate) depolymerase
MPKRSRCTVIAVFLLAWTTQLDADEVTGIKAIHRHGQTFVTWKDAAEGEAGAKFRYSLYRSDSPITAENLARAELCYHGVLNNSAKLYGSAFNMQDRLDPAKPYAVLSEGGQPLPPWSGLAVRTIQQPGRSYYAVVATDENYHPVGKAVPGKSATTEAVEEKPAPIQAIKLYDSKERTGPYVRNTQITGQKGLPLQVTLHGSSSRGGGAGEYGDYYLYFGTPEMGYRDGLPGVFSVSETRRKEGNVLLLRLRDAVEHPGGKRAMETYWFGYLCVPQGVRHAEPRVYPFTENQIVWITRWVVERYQADANRIYVGGSSSGGVGSNNVGFRHPELFAAVYPVVGRARRVPAVALEGKFDRAKGALMADGKTQYYDHVDGPKFAAAHHEDLPFLAWACGRHDGYATWQEHIDMVRAMTEARHGFAFSWNNGNHSGGGRAKEAVSKYYPPEKFARNQSYPAFGNSSINNNMGNGDPNDGDPVGGINLGFLWGGVSDKPNRWSVKFANDLAKEEMTVDVTPRRCQQFKPRPGDVLRWTNSAGGAGKATADEWGLVTVEKVKIVPGQETVLTIER